MKNSPLAKGTMIAAILTAIVGSLCCIGPLVLITLGLGSAWIGALGKFHAIHPYAAIITAGFMGFAFWQLYIQSRRCKEKAACRISKSLKIQRILFWVILVLAALLLTFSYYGQWLI